MEHTKLLNQFKDHFSDKSNKPLDFRRDVYAPNNYGLAPIVSYDRAKEIVLALYEWANDFIADNKGCFLDFGGWEYNLDMEIEKLRSSDIKTLVSGIVNDLVANYKEPEFSITEVEYDPEIGSAIVDTQLNDQAEKFYVQLCGGEYLSQMGCWITTDSSNGDIDPDDYPGFNIDKIVSEAEQAYSSYVEDELDDGSTWVEAGEINHKQISATSYSSLVVEKNTDPDAIDQYRVYAIGSGFTQPNDYSSLPDLEIKYFMSLDDLKSFYNKNENEALNELA